MIPSRVLSLTTTVGNEDDARRLAQALVAARLAACVQVEKIESHYHWQGALQAAPEVRLTVKSMPELLPALQVLLCEIHPYDLPQVLWQVQEASAGYAQWVRTEVEAG